MRSATSLLVASASIPLVVGQTWIASVYNTDPSNLYPNTTYPDAVSSDPVVEAGTNDFQKSPPGYPSPWGEGLGDWSSAYEKARAFVSQLTLEEKVNLTTGSGWELEACVGMTGSVPRLGFAGLCLQDGPLSVRNTDFNSIFPAGLNVAATWDRNLAYLRGQAMGTEHKGKGSDVQLGPVAGPLGRTPEGARNWEGFSPDPWLTGVLFAESIKGIQSAGIMANAKHYIAYEQDHFRLVEDSTTYGFNITEPISSNLDDQTLHELYLWPFADGVRAGAASVMCSYNQINNSQACQNSYLLNHVLKGELGFQGFVVSDWIGTHSGVSSILAGLDMTMPGDAEYNSGTSYYGANLTIAVLNGTVPQWRLDDAAVRILAGYYYVGRDKTRTPPNFLSWTTDTFSFANYYVGKNWGLVNQHVDVRGEHAKLIREIGAKSIVLLKNVNNTLPLTGKEKLTAVIGEDAGGNPYGPNGCSDRGCDNGTLAQGWGSGSGNFANLITPDFAIQSEVLSNGGAYESITDNWSHDAIGTLARRSNVTIAFANSDSGEWYLQVDGNLGDRNNLTFWQGADEMLDVVLGNSSNVVLVVHSVGPVLLEKYQNHPNVTAIVWAGLPGEQSGNSLTDVLYGRVNPGAKLPFTAGKDRKDYGTDILYKVNHPVPQTNFKEGVFIDYRAFDKLNTSVVYPFGFGLSYTTFSYSNLQIKKIAAANYTGATGKTSAAPTYGTIDNSTSSHLFPANFTKIPLYQYSWLNVSDLKAASGDPNYGTNFTFPAGSSDGSPQDINPAGGAPGGNPQLWDVLFQINASITNTGSIAGDEVPQLYISLGGSSERNPPRVLRGFERLSIQPNQTVTATFDVTRRDLSNWSVEKQNWYISDDVKVAYVGSSSRDLPLSAVLQ